MSNLTFAFVGLGLIGGSIAKAVKLHYPGSRILACDPDRHSLELSTKEGVAERTFEGIDAISGPFLGNADILFLCAPVAYNSSNLLALKPYLSADCILTDVGSVKSTIYGQIQALGLSSRFIGGHPMAGSERIGYANSKAGLLENAYYILTPTRDVSQERVELFSSIAAGIGAIPLVLDASRHDYVTAAVSHLPHVIASSLVNLVKDSDGKDGTMKMIAAGGFKDITRIASSSPQMWQQICLTNAENISELLGRYIDSLSQAKEFIDSGVPEALYTFFDTARAYRDSFIDASSGPIKKVFTINIEIPDEAGSLASVATLLALNQINIKNIGIVHNREAAEGVLRIEFYEEASIEKAAKLLSGRGYAVYTQR